MTPSGIRNCSNLQCGATGLTSETCPRCGAPTFRASNPTNPRLVADDPEAARKRRESLEAVPPEVMARLHDIKEQSTQANRPPARTVNILIGLGLVTVALLALALLLANNRDDAGSDQDDVRASVQRLLMGYENSQADALCEELSSSAKESLGGPCPQVVAARIQSAPASPEVGMLVSNDVQVDGESATLSVRVGNASFTVPVEKEGGDWRVSDFAPVDQIIATVAEQAATPTDVVEPPPAAGATGATGATGGTGPTGSTGPTGTTGTQPAAP